MAEKCPVCGQSVGGLTGMPKPGKDLKEKGISIGVYEDGMCASCLSRALKGKVTEKTDEEISEGNKAIRTALPRVFVSPSSIPDGLPDMGLVTGYCILGTGPFTALFSGVTDALGRKSNAYMQKARDAEREALDALKIEALKKGADAVYCLRLNLTEATSGNGMLMVSVTGAATSTGRDDPAIQKAIDYLKS